MGAKAEIEKLIGEFADKASACSSFPLKCRARQNCDRIIVLRDGKIVGELTDEDISEDNIMWMIANKKSIHS